MGGKRRPVRIRSRSSFDESCAAFERFCLALPQHKLLRQTSKLIIEVHLIFCHDGQEGRPIAAHHN
jgi:hypothetical protein